MDSFGSLLRNKRKQEGLTLQDLSGLLSERCRKGGIAWYPDAPQLSRWETGQTVPKPKHRDVVKAIADILGMDDSERNELLARAGLSPLRSEEMDIDAILSTLQPRWRKSWFLSKWMVWNRDQIANKLGIAWFEVMHDIEKAEERLKSETKEETKMEQNQSTLNLPPWVDRAQWEHLEGREQRDELGEGIGIITYPGGIGIRQQLGLFRGCFSDINPRNQSFWRPLDEVVMAQLHGHLPDEAFWERVEGSEGFIKKAKECETLLDAARKRFTTAGEELAPLEPPRGSTPDAYITSGWAHKVLVWALNPEFGLGDSGEYYHGKLEDGGSILHAGELIYRGLDDVAAEKKHRQAVDDFRNSQEFTAIVNLMKQLLSLRQQILARIDQCLRKREYSYNYCPDCPADQARKMLASKGE